MKRTATIKCVTACVLYSLSKKQLDEVLLHHPQMTAAIRAVAEQRLKLTEEAKAREGREESVISVDNNVPIMPSKIDEFDEAIDESEEFKEECSDVHLSLVEYDATELTELRPNGSSNDE